MALSKAFLDHVSKTLPPSVRGAVYIESASPLGGGDINAAYRLNTAGGPFFIKVNSAARFPGMFEKEAAGLDLLASTGEDPGARGDHSMASMEMTSSWYWNIIALRSA